MNNDLISRSALLKNKTRMTEYDESGCGVHVFVVKEEDVLDAPSVDAEVVRHGIPVAHYETWCNSDGEPVITLPYGYECPFCGNVGIKNYCPNCGAKMDGDANNAAD